jgi:hypothetical protein
MRNLIFKGLRDVEGDNWPVDILSSFEKIRYCIVDLKRFREKRKKVF